MICADCFGLSVRRKGDFDIGCAIALKKRQSAGIFPVCRKSAPLLRFPVVLFDR